MKSKVIIICLIFDPIIVYIYRQKCRVIFNMIDIFTLNKFHLRPADKMPYKLKRKEEMPLYERL